MNLGRFARIVTLFKPLKTIMGKLLGNIIGSLWWILRSSGLARTLCPFVATWTPSTTPTGPVYGG
jgi:hypothetical protein